MAQNGFWVFAYGSLLWRPGFECDIRVVADLTGYRRSFCMTSIEYRGTPDAPGLVLALEAHHDATCAGMGLYVPAEIADETLAYLRARELISAAYLEVWTPIALRDGRVVEAVTYIMDQNHDQYAGSLDLDAQAQIIAHAVGPMGPNVDYLRSTVDALHSSGIADPELDQLDVRVAELISCR